MNPQPPRRALSLLRWFCREDYLEEFEGDLIELFELRYEVSPMRARRKFFWGVLRCFRPGFIKSFYQFKSSNYTAMFRHNLLITFRNFRRHKGSFFINLTGLSVGILSALLIYFWVYSEVTVDAFHEKDERLFQVMRSWKSGELFRTGYSNSDLLPPALRAELPEVESVVPFAPVFSEVFLSFDESKLKGEGYLVGKEFFDVFSYDLLKGSRKQAFSDLNNIVLSKQLAERLFNGREVELGEIVTISDETEYGARYAGDYVVSGVFDLSRHNTSAEFDFLLSHDLFLKKRGPGNDVWYSNSARVYITMKEGTDMDQFDKKLKDFYQAKMEPFLAEGERDEASKPTMFLQQYSQRYLYNQYQNGVQSGGRIDYVILFAGIGLMMLLVACINFMNLSTAQAFRRLKEVGVKKVVGASRRSLSLQYVTESIVLASLATLLATITAVAIYPSLNMISERELQIQWTPGLVLGVMFITVVTGIFAGSYPAFFISRMRPLQILKGKLKTSMGELFVRKGLVIFQFCVSLVLIVTVIVLTQQIEYTKNKNLGYDRDNVLVFPIEGKLLDSHEAFVNEAKNLSGVRNAAITQGSPANFRNSGGSYPKEGMPLLQYVFARVGYDYVEALGIEMLEGRTFSREFANEGAKIILNETAVKAMGLTDPVGQILSIRGKREVIGVMKDFHYRSLHEEIKPSFLIFVPEDANRIVVKIQAGQEREAIEGLIKLYEAFNPDLPFQFNFLDENYQALYLSEQRTASLFRYFAMIAIFISCLGLLGLSAFTVQLRMKEIGIRKVLGSTVWRIIRLLSKDLTQTVLISLVVSIPLAYFMMQNWLEGFAYRVNLSGSTFVISGIAVVLLAWGIVAFQALRAARVNPVECLKDE